MKMIVALLILILLAILMPGFIRALLGLIALVVFLSVIGAVHAAPVCATNTYLTTSGICSPIPAYTGHEPPATQGLMICHPTGAGEICDWMDSGTMGLNYMSAHCEWYQDVMSEQLKHVWNHDAYAYCKPF
jgi:disulfide bond formation protein DsbB